MTRLLMTYFLVMILSVAGCSDSDPWSPESTSPPTPHHDKAALVSMSPASLDDGFHEAREPIGHYYHANQEALGRQTFQVAYKLERAIWRFADDNNGEVPDILGDTNLVGKYLYDYLPGKMALINPWSRMRTNPGDQAASSRGQVGYETIWNNGYLVGFRITAMGTGYPHQYLHFDRYMTDRYGPRPPLAGPQP